VEDELSMRLLVADDDRATQTMLKSQLERGGHEVVLASDGYEAWRVLQRADICLAVLDWNMPGMTGVEICRRLPQLGRAVYIIVLTAEEGITSTTMALDAGASDYINKPWSSDVLLARVNVGVRTVTLQSQLAQAQKLESIGQLAAGIAHEINTPTQFIGDNTRFLQDAFGDLRGLLVKYAQLAEAGRTGSVTPEILADVDAAAKEVDLDYLNEQVPLAIAQALEGVGRVANIVRAMKDFSHPGGEGMEVVDLNRAIESTITVARNEWKYVAEMVTDFDPALPFVVCQIGDFNQVILNIVINAAHAIAGVVGDGAAGKGTITVSTRRDGDWAEIRIRDTGTGIAPEHRSKVFDHFFTTKEVGRGTGQGLAIAHAVIAEKHGGTITFETETGKGTTFVIRLPIQPELATPKETPQHEAAYSLR